MAAEAGSWAAGTVQRVKGKDVQSADPYAAMGMGAPSNSVAQRTAKAAAEAKAAARTKKAEEAAKAGAARMAALQPKVAAKGARLVPTKVATSSKPMLPRAAGRVGAPGAPRPMLPSKVAAKAAAPPPVPAATPAAPVIEIGHAMAQPAEWLRLGSGLAPQEDEDEDEDEDEEEDEGDGGGAMMAVETQEERERREREAAEAERIRSSRVPMGPTEWLNVWVAQRSPFSTAAERAALVGLSEADPFISLDQVQRKA